MREAAVDDPASEDLSSMRFRSNTWTLPALATALIALIAAAPLAAAQTPADATLTVTIQNLPAAFPSIAANGTGTAAFSVQVAMTNVICTSDSTIPITITVTPSTSISFFTTMLDPENAAIPIGAGPHQTFSGSVDFALIGTAAEITANATADYEIAAGAGVPTGCSGNGLSGATSEPAITSVSFTAPPPPPPPTPTEETPGIGLIAAIAAMVVVALVRQRRS